MIDAAGHPFSQLGYQPPAAGDIGPPLSFPQGFYDLPGCFFGGGDPESFFRLGHFSIYEARLYVGDIYRPAGSFGFHVETFEINALEGFAGAVGGSVAIAADAGDGGGGG